MVLQNNFAILKLAMNKYFAVIYRKILRFLKPEGGGEPLLIKNKV